MNLPTDVTGTSLEREAEIFEHWASLISSMYRRVYYRDQSVETFLSLTTQAKAFKPTVIIELGTRSGLSLRTWLRAVPEAKVKAIDLSFDSLKMSAEIIPYDASRVTLIKSDILKVDFKKLWGPEDRVLFFVDAHDLPDVPIMAHVIKNAFPYLPSDNLVIVDDIWFSPETVTAENADAVFRRDILSSIDELQLFEACYAPYHKTGYFWGFYEVFPLFKFINQHGISLTYSENTKNVSFSIKQLQKIDFDNAVYAKQCGIVYYHPLEIECSGNALISKTMEQAKKLYAKLALADSIELLTSIAEKTSWAPGLAYALGVCFAKAGIIDTARKMLALDLNSPNAHPGSQRLLDGVENRFGRLRVSGKSRKPGITLVTVPKAFKGHIDIIQRNALASWCQLAASPEIIVMGDDEGTEDVCREFNLRHVPKLKRNEMGTPLFDDIMFKAQTESSTEIIAYVNTDIILFDSFMKASALAAKRFEDFLLVGARIEYPQKELIDFNSEWAEPLLDLLTETGEVHPPTGMDYFVFKPGFWPHMPPFALGRFYWDTWMMNDAAQRKVDVIDCTSYINVVHQAHDYSHVPGDPAFSIRSDNYERVRNYTLMGECRHGNAACHSTWVMLNDGRIVKRWLRGAE